MKYIVKWQIESLHPELQTEEFASLDAAMRSIDYLKQMAMRLRIKFTISPCYEMIQ